MNEASYNEAGKSSLPGLLLLLEPGGLPDHDALHRMIADIPRADVSIPRILHASGIVEVIVDGLTFDIHGLASDAPISPPRIQYAFDCRVEDLAGCDVMGLYPAPHLAGGANALPVIRTLLSLGVKLAERIDGVRAVCWTPARTAIAASTFIDAVNAWLAGGQIPAPGLFGLYSEADGTWRTDGLAFLFGRELVIDKDLCNDEAAAMRMAASIAHDLAGYGAPDVAEDRWLEDGCAIRLEPDDRTATVGVRPAPKSAELAVAARAR